MSDAKVVGIRAVKFPDDDGVVRGVGYTLRDAPNVWLALRENPPVARGIAGFDPVIFAIPDRAAAEAWVERLEQLGIEHSPVIDATLGWLVVFHDPDGTEIHLYSVEEHGIDPGGRTGYGRRTRT